MRLRRTELSITRVGTDYLALDLRSSEYLSFTGVAAVIVERLTGGADRSEVVAAITATYEVDDEAAGRDLDAFLARLAAADLLEP